LTAQNRAARWAYEHQTLEGGRVCLKADVRLPEGARVYVLVPDRDVIEVQA
jgi:hypothetical protein